MTTAARTARPGRPSATSVRLSLLIAAMATVTLVRTLLWDQPLPDDGESALLAVLLLAGAFLAVETMDLKILSFGASTHAVTASELPFVLGVLTTDPRLVLAARLMASLLHGGVLRRQPTLKLVFNVTQHAASVAVGLTVTLAIDPDRALTPLGLLAAGLGALSLDVLSKVAVLGAITLVDGTNHLGRLRVTVPTGIIAALLCTLLGFLCVSAGRNDSWQLIPIGVLVAGLAWVARLTVALRERHARLQLLTEFMTGVQQAEDFDGGAGPLLTRLCELLNAGHASVLLTDSDAGTVAGRAGATMQVHVLDATGVRSTRRAHDSGDWVLARALAGGTPLRLARGSSDPAVSGWLAQRGLADAVVAPFPADCGVRGVVIVGSRLTTYGSFTDEDLRVLAGVARHTGATLRSSGLLHKLVHDARHDALTGLPNRAEFRRRVEAALAGLPDGPLAILLMDLDRFKDVNDSLGHAAGDRLLTEIGERVAAHAPAGATVARLGGDEFAVLLPGADAATAAHVATGLRAVIARPLTVGWLTTSLGASVGIALSPAHGTEAEVLQSRADLAMYAAKGGAGVCAYRHDLDDHALERLALLADLRAAVASRSLEVHVQPKARPSGEVTGVEALLRWQHPVRGWVSPEEIVPLAEGAGLLPQITALVLERSLDAVLTWRQAGRDLGVAVNLSARDLLDPELPARVQASLLARGLPPRLLTLEITESTLMGDRERCTDTLRRLRELGVRLSVDDFGTGYSSLAYLRSLPVHEVKIDRSFVTSLASSPPDRAIVRAVTSLARDLDLVVVAEGVEDGGSWDVASELGCDQMQGWHLSRAMAPQEMLPWLARRDAAAAQAAAAAAAAAAGPVGPVAAAGGGPGAAAGGGAVFARPVGGGSTVAPLHGHERRSAVVPGQRPAASQARLTSLPPAQGRMLAG